MADPGFLIGGCPPVEGAGLRRGHFLTKTCAKTKELAPVGVGYPPIKVSVTLYSGSFVWSLSIEGVCFILTQLCC